MAPIDALRSHLNQRFDALERRMVDRDLALSKALEPVSAETLENRHRIENMEKRSYMRDGAVGIVALVAGWIGWDHVVNLFKN